jgi:spore coat polysaccharide biosynthesis protein SpsF
MNETDFWAGNFGNDYTDRNTGNAMIESNISLFSDALAKTKGVKTLIELGCNKGLNLAAIDYIDPSIVATGVDVNAKALLDLATMFEALGKEQPYTYRSSIQEFDTDEKFDLVLVKGVLIHINPDDLPVVYDQINYLSSKYILICEYFNPTPMEITYRGHHGRLWKRDFAGEMMDKYKLNLVTYGFVYSRDKFPQDNIHWFLLSKEA